MKENERISKEKNYFSEGDFLAKYLKNRMEWAFQEICRIYCMG